MQVILKQDIKRFGQKGQLVNVSDGYANSYLIPKGLAKVATAGEAQHAQAQTQHKQEKIQQKQSEQEDQFKKFNKKKITVQANVNPAGKLFNAISVSDITAQLPGLQPGCLNMKKGIKELGEHQIPLQIGNLKGHITVQVER